MSDTSAPAHEAAGSAQPVPATRSRKEPSTLRIGRRYRANRLRGPYDVIVIGSGMGGLSAAALLAHTGKKVVVLEQHFTAGGFTHAYARNGYEWDVGVHYIGDVGRQTVARRLFDFISGGQLDWAPMDPVYDRMIIGGERYDFVAGAENFKAELKKHFPQEAHAIDRYLELVFQASRYMAQFSKLKILPGWLRKIMQATGKNAFPEFIFQDTYSVLQSITRNEQLIAVLSGQWGDQGLPPKQSVFLMHAILCKHYINGGFYPVGGASRIAETIIPQIQYAGGEVFTYADVKEILLRDGRAYGVKMQDDNCIEAPVVISNAGVINTFEHLLPASESERLGYRAKAQHCERSMSHMGMYIGLKGSAEELQLPKTNLWIYPSGDHDANVAAFATDIHAPLPVVYVSFPSAKDPDFARRYPGRSTIEIVSGPCNYSWFSQWAKQTWGKRGDDYEALKEQLSQRMLEVLYQHMPQLRGKIDYYETSTPLSTDFFCRYQHGEAYGLAHTRQRFEQDWLQPKTRVAGLYLTGQDIVTCGVVGALMQGMLTAMQVLGFRRSQKLMRDLKAGQLTTTTG